MKSRECFLDINVKLKMLQKMKADGGSKDIGMALFIMIRDVSS